MVDEVPLLLGGARTPVAGSRPAAMPELPIGVLVAGFDDVRVVVVLVRLVVWLTGLLAAKVLEVKRFALETAPDPFVGRVVAGDLAFEIRVRLASPLEASLSSPSLIGDGLVETRDTEATLAVAGALLTGVVGALLVVRLREALVGVVWLLLVAG